jgi:hypothetical protein
LPQEPSYKAIDSILLEYVRQHPTPPYNPPLFDGRYTNLRLSAKPSYALHSR